MSAPVSIRTQVRDAFVAALESMAGSSSARLPGADILTAYSTVEEVKKFPSYCVVATDEAIELKSQMAADISMTILVVLYVKSDGDVRALLDAAIEDVWEALRGLQLLKSVASQLQIESITTDEGTTVVKPYAQAVMRWTAQVRRAVTW